MPPGTQQSYTQLPDGRWILTPTNPADLAKLKSWLDAHSEKASVAALPNAAQQAKASIKTDLQPVSRLTGDKIAQTNDTDKDAGSTTMRAVENFNQSASPVGGRNLPEALHNLNELRKEGPFSAVEDILQRTSDATTDAMQTYGEKDYRRYIGAIPLIGPTLAANEDKGLAEGGAGDVGALLSALAFGKEAGPERPLGELSPEEYGKKVQAETSNTVRATNEAYNKIFNDPKLSMRDATNLLANELSTREISPADYGKSLQETFDTVKNKAGAEKREFLEGVMRQNPDMRVSPRAVNEVLQQEVKNLQFMKERNPELFKEGTAQERTLAILERELRNTQDYNLGMADTRRSQFWNYKQQLDPSMASRIVGDLDRATTQDITRSLAQKDPKLAQEYLEKSARYRELNDIGRADVLKQVFGNNRVSPDRVMEFLNKAPEESLKAIQTLQRENPQAVADMRRQLFEQSMKTAGAKGLMKLQPSLVKAIYGHQADAVMQFMDIINKKSPAPDSLVTRVPGLKGAGIRIDMGKGKPAITIRASEMAKILRSSEMMRLFTHAAETPTSAGPSALMRDTLQRAIDAAGIRTEAEQRPSRVPAWKREGGGGENPPGGAPTSNEPTPPAQGGPSGAYGGPERRTAEAPDRRPLWQRQRETDYKGPERRAESRSGASSRQLADLHKQLREATEQRDKDIINARIKELKAHPEDAEAPERNLDPNQPRPKADPKNIKKAIEKQRQRTSEFEQEGKRLLGEEFDF